MKLKAKNRRNNRAVSPVISTVIITATIIALVTVAVVFANNFLSARLAESDFNAAKQFMQTLGLQIDDVAWRMGQTETVRYSSRYGDINMLSNVNLNYTIEIKTLENNSTYQAFYTNKTRFLFFNMPISQYTVSNNYFEQIWPTKVSTLTLKGSSASTSTVFAIEKMPMSDGNYVRVVTAPVIRLINSTIVTATNSTFYFKLYLPLLSLDTSPKKSQSVTLTGDSVSVKTKNHITSIRITVYFPQAPEFDNTFFHFPSVQEVINAPSGYPALPTKDCVIELYTGAVSVSLGANV
jgi:hypothetical protein